MYIEYKFASFPALTLQLTLVSLYPTFACGVAPDGGVLEYIPCTGWAFEAPEMGSQPSLCREPRAVGLLARAVSFGILPRAWVGPLSIDRSDQASVIIQSLEACGGREPRRRGWAI